jgi:hypothetical protein
MQPSIRCFGTQLSHPLGVGQDSSTAASLSTLPHSCIRGLRISSEDALDFGDLFCEMLLLVRPGLRVSIRLLLN